MTFNQGVGITMREESTEVQMLRGIHRTLEEMKDKIAEDIIAML
jgi:hypothetical protein